MTSIGEGIVTALETAFDETALPGRVHLDFAPEDVQVPYVTYNDAVATGPTLKGDARAIYFDRSLQVNVWQNDQEEDPDLPWNIAQALDGLRVETDEPGDIMLLRVESVLRVAEPQDSNLTHHEITVAVPLKRGVG